jgi:signal transduction histidine kinase
MNRRTAIIFYILSAYVLIQFLWWGFHIIQLTSELTGESDAIGKRIVMIMGEGAVFLLLLLVGIWQIRRAIIKELKLSERQNNFLLSVTHELKTPLAANKLYLQTIKKRDLTKEQTQELIDKALSENGRLERMIDNILNASRLENNSLKLNKEEFDLHKLIISVADRFESFNPNWKIEIDAKGSGSVFADRFMIESVLSNLIENAIKYAGKDADITIYSNENHEQLIFGVKDNGNGVENNLKTEIFKKFYRTGNEETRTQKGSGLGLFIVKQLILLHGGQIVCIDNASQGADFQIKLPKHGA